MIEGWDDIVEGVARAIHTGKMQGNISPEMIRAQGEHFYGAVQKGWGATTDSVVGEDAVQLAALRENVFVFSGFKTHAELTEVRELLLDSSGKVRPFADFLKDVRAIDHTYSRNYLQAEYNHALTGSAMISKWKTITKEAEALPLLEFSAVMDGHTRDTHAALNEVVRPINDSFWNTHYPPLDWNCRCDVLQRPGTVPVTDEDKIASVELKPMFRNNVGKVGIVFPEKHPYYQQSISKETRKEIKKVAKREAGQTTDAIAVVQALKARGVRLRYDYRDDEATIAKGLSGKFRKFDPTVLMDGVDAAFADFNVQWSTRDILMLDKNVGPDGKYMFLRMEGLYKGEKVEISRYFLKKDKVHYVKHDIFVIPDSMQGQGFSKAVFKPFYQQYQNLGVKEIKVWANLKVGGYTWAKYGFRGISRYDTDALLSKAKRMLPVEKYNRAKRVYDTYYKRYPDGIEFPMDLWTKVEGMKEVMLGSSWDGNINLRNKKQRTIFEAYLGWNNG